MRLQPNHALAQARQWHVRLHDEQLSPADRQGFRRWLAAHPDHRQAWEEVAALVQRLDQDMAAAAPVLKRLYPLNALTADEAIAAQADALASRPEIAASAGMSRRRLLSVAAAAGLLLGGGVLLQRIGPWGDYRSGRGERRQFHLPDGSVVEIGAETAFSADFTARQRQIVLRQGDAFFTVAADIARPFVVQAGGARIKALGTQFSLRVRDDVVDLAVREHAVAVEVAGQPSRRVEAGQGLHMVQEMPGAVFPVDLAVAEAWRNDRLLFTNVALRDVVREIDRYRRGAIIITDPALAGLRVTGSFRTDDTDAALHTIAQTLPLRVEDFLGLVVLIRPIG
ncbi:MAG TPA: FecR domain-containing protein [Terriglobia bacterium]|nr:FecR domain-containing protein [Terriglobia bacterium]